MLYPVKEATKYCKACKDGAGISALRIIVWELEAACPYSASRECGGSGGCRTFKQNSIVYLELFHFLASFSRLDESKM